MTNDIVYWFMNFKKLLGCKKNKNYLWLFDKNIILVGYYDENLLGKI